MFFRKPSFDAFVNSSFVVIDENLWVDRDIFSGNLYDKIVGVKPMSKGGWYMFLVNCFGEETVDIT